MASGTSLGFVGMLAVLLLVGAACVGQAVYGGLGMFVGLVLGFFISGWVLRSYFARSGPSTDGG